MSLLHAYDLVLLAKIEDDLQRETYITQKIYSGYYIKSPTKKTKTMAFSEKCPVRTNIVILKKNMGEKLNKFIWNTKTQKLLTG